MRSVCIQSNMNVIRGLVKRAQLLWKLHNISDTCTTSLTRAQHLWHVHNISDTCTTSLKRAQHLWHVHNISDTCTTSLKRAHIEYLKTLGGGGGTRYTHIYIDMGFKQAQCSWSTAVLHLTREFQIPRFSQLFASCRWAHPGNCNLCLGIVNLLGFNGI